MAMIRIAKKAYDDMIAHGKACHPQEACGFLAGKPGEATVFIPIENSDHSTVSYLMDPKQQMKAFKRMQGENLELVGIFHTHVASPASPSQKDRSMAFYPEVSYVIASLADMQKPDVKSWRLEDGKETAEEIKLS